MRVNSVYLKTLSNEKTLRSDFDYHKYQKQIDSEFYSFSDLFEIVEQQRVDLDNLYEDFKYCEIGDVDGYGNIYPKDLNFSIRNLVDEDYYKKIEKGDIVSVEKGDILISSVRPNLKKFVLIDENSEKVYFTSAFIQVRPKTLVKIMYYCIRTVFYESIIAISRQGKGYPTLNRSDLRDLRFSKSKIDNLIRNENSFDNLIETYKIFAKELCSHRTSEQSIIDSVFEENFEFESAIFKNIKDQKSFTRDFSFLSSDYDLRFSSKFHRPSGQFVIDRLRKITSKKIKDYLDIPIELGTSVSPKDYDEDGEYCYISMATIRSWSFSSNDSLRVSVEYSNIKRAKNVQINDIIMARSGEGTIGKVAIIKDEEVNGIFSDFTMRIRLKNYNQLFAYYYFRTTYFQYLVEIFKKGLGNNTNIFPKTLEHFPMPSIDEDHQLNIASKIESEIDMQLLNEHKNIQYMQMIEDALWTVYN